MRKISQTHQRTTIMKPAETDPQWVLIDGTDQIVGRMASKIAMMLMGKHRPTYTPHVLTGDFVIVTNCEKVKFTGKKWEQKTYAWYTGYTRQRTMTAEDRLQRRPEKIVREAVRRMLPKNKLASQMLDRLKIYEGAEHPHQAQQPQTLEIASAS
ncbi:50S ribosomal protein L13 [Botrimarina hoheduenensis]|uniref:Large ribosomal subunit protein uL13 n=1 Tax=Botrimarina hoheduenensis TaxID=2528000 RepID=A0A5C5VXB4_9BACT|nr:50S ribosomal protein L13 [Botrimarina hoheduenensis]TWT42777.1 50S ribosomal protein L13 [Botrimarina hoheduenensis]